MKYEEALKLLEAGFSADDIKAMTAEPEKQEPEKKEPEKQEPVKEDPRDEQIAELTKAVGTLTKSMQAIQISLSTQPGASGTDTVDDILAKIINPFDD